MGNVTQLVHETAAELHIILSRLFEAIYSTFHHSWNRLIGSKPSVNFPPKESAVLLVGAEEGVGRTMALKFAQEGYTVFACIPNYHASIHQPEQAGVSNVASLVYSWQMSSHHKNQRRCPESERGSIIPISFDFAKLEDRHHTLDTVIAYCARHSLQLSSLVLSPRSRDAPTLSPSAKSAFAAEQHCIVPVPLSTTKELVSAELIQRDVIEPVLVLQDFLGLLTVNEGKIVILTGCSEAGSEVLQGTTAPCDAAREAIASQFQQELTPQGVSVSLVIGAPLSGRLRELRTPGITFKPTLSNTSKTSTHVHSSITWSSVIQTIDDDTVFSIVLRAINSPYPRLIYYAGISVYIQRWAQVIPGSLWSLV